MEDPIRSEYPLAVIPPRHSRQELKQFAFVKLNEAIKADKVTSDTGGVLTRSERRAAARKLAKRFVSARRGGPTTKAE